MCGSFYPHCPICDELLRDHVSNVSYSLAIARRWWFLHYGPR